MSSMDTAMAIMDELFAKDCIFALATTSGSKPSVRMIDTYYEDGAFYMVTHARSVKVKEMERNDEVALCKHAYRFEGIARNIGHPLDHQNTAIREKLTRVFAPWYFKHNDEKDASMCYVKIELCQGFFHKDGTGYSVDFKNGRVEEFPFTFDAIIPE